MSAAAEKAIQLDPLLAEAHEALGMVYARDEQWERSEESFRRGIELDPNRATSYVAFDEDLLPLGRIQEALHRTRIAEKADPLSPAVSIGKTNAVFPSLAVLGGSGAREAGSRVA